MPVQAEGKGAEPSPFDAVLIQIGQDGLNTKKSLSAMGPTDASRLINAIPVMGGQLLTRAGQTVLATGVGSMHSIRRLNDPGAPAISGGAAFTRFWGQATSVFRGASGGLSVLDTGYSGSPVTMLPFRPPLSGQSYMFIADTAKMRKASASGNILPIGLPKPTTPTTAIFGTNYQSSIAEFSATDATAAANWTTTAGVDESGTPADPPTLFDEGAGSVRMHVDPGAAASGYSSIISIATVRDLTVLNPGGTLVAATDDDEMMIVMRVNDPSDVAEVRLYLVCSNDFLTGIIPGTSVDNNTNAFVKAFRPNDFQDFISLSKNTAIDTSSALRTNQLLDQFANAGANNSASPGQNIGTTPSVTMALGAQATDNFGTIGLPVRRGEYTRIGGDTTVGWDNITGLVITVQMNTNIATDLAFSTWRLSGGTGVDNADPGEQKFDYRCTNYDPRTGAESNPSDVQAESLWLDSNRQPVAITPAAYGDPVILQRIYRRGGTLTGDWFFCGTNASDGGQFIDGIDFTVSPAIAANTDATIEAAGAVEIDHDQPVTTVDLSGNAVYNQPLRTIWGPVAGMIMGTGDPYRPGLVYWCIPGQPDHWPAANWVEVCAPSEELMNGGVFGGQAFVFSRERGYLLSTNLAGVADTIVATPTDCTPGMASYWGICIGPDAIYYVAKDGVRATRGGESAIVSDQIRTLFNGQTKNGLLPIDFTQPASIRLEAFNNDIWFTYKDTGGTLITQVYSVLYKIWRQVSFANPAVVVYADPTQGEAGQLLLVGAANGIGYSHTGTTDAGTAIACQVRTGALDFGHPRGETLFGDVVIDADMQGTGQLQCTTYVNDEVTTVGFQAATGVSGSRRYLFDAFGTGITGPQKARNLSIDLQWSGTSGVSPVIERVVQTLIPQPNITMQRVTSWAPLNESGEAYLKGVWLDIDTGGQAVTIAVEGLLSDLSTGTTVNVATISVTATGRHRQYFSWSGVHCDMVRLRPTSTCTSLELYAVGWMSDPEPPRIQIWDTNFETLGDTYYTGLDLEVDTFGVAKSIDIYVDGVLIQTSSVTANGRKFVHITMVPGRGHVYRFVATDSNNGLLYNHKWITAPEPGEQTNWNQNFTVSGTLADKWLKGCVLECDTFGVNKTVTIEVDGVVVSTETVNTNGRKVFEISFPQSLGRVFRLLPTDANPGRLYSMEWIFDEEPLALSRWETQELDFGVSGWKLMPASWVSLKSTADVTMTTTVYGQSGVAMATLVNTIPSTAGAKQKVYVPFAANKGMLYKFVFTSSAKFWLYREESLVYVQPWGEPEAKPVKPFGNDDLDLVRGMHHAALMAAQQGGGTS